MTAIEDLGEEVKKIRDVSKRECRNTRSEDGGNWETGHRQTLLGSKYLSRKSISFLDINKSTQCLCYESAVGPSEKYCHEVQVEPWL